MHYPANIPKRLLKRPGFNTSREHAMIETFVLKEIHDEIESLPGLCKTVFKLIFFENLVTPQIAEKLHISDKRVLKYQQQALTILRFTVLRQCLSRVPENTPVE